MYRLFRVYQSDGFSHTEEDFSDEKDDVLKESLKAKFGAGRVNIVARETKLGPEHFRDHETWDECLVYGPEGS